MLRGWPASARAEECDARSGARADLERVPESLVGDVRNVDHDAEAIQLADDVLAEVGEAVVRRLVARRIAPGRVHAVREGEVAHAEAVIVAEDGQALVDHVAALHPHSAAIFPALCAARTSAAVVASTISFGCCSASRLTASMSTSDRLTASGPVTVPGM